MDWSKIWWACDLSYTLRLYWHSFSRDNSDASEKTISAVFEDILWTLDKGPKMAFITIDSGRSFRKEWYPEYKAGRIDPGPEYWGCYDAALRSIKDGLLDVCHVISCEGWESDDCMASVARLAVENGDLCVMMTQDKDLRQCLIPDQVTTQRRMRDEQGRPDWGWFNCADAEADWFGTRPEQFQKDEPREAKRQRFIDYQILVGDSGDNIPHPKGIGPKSAVRLLEKFGNIPTLKAGVESKAAGIKDSELRSLSEFWIQEPLVRSLVTLNDHVDFKNVLFKGN